MNRIHSWLKRQRACSHGEQKSWRRIVRLRVAVGPYLFASVGPKIATVGTFTAEAKCSEAESLVMTSFARCINAPAWRIVVSPTALWAGRCLSR